MARIPLWPYPLWRGFTVVNSRGVCVGGITRAGSVSNREFSPPRAARVHGSAHVAPDAEPEVRFLAVTLQALQTPRQYYVEFSK